MEASQPVVQHVNVKHDAAAREWIGADTLCYLMILTMATARYAAKTAHRPKRRRRRDIRPPPSACRMCPALAALECHISQVVNGVGKWGHCHRSPRSSE